MRIAFCSNFLSAHQKPLCDVLYKKTNYEFRFIATSPLSETRKAMGWNEENTPYVIASYKNDEAYEEAIQFIKEAAVVLIGSDDDTEFFRLAVKNTHTMIFRCCERVYRRGRWRVISPKGIKKRWNTYYKYPKNRLYMLCASAYTAGDYALLGSYIGRCYKWGYFTEVECIDISKILDEKDQNLIFWAGRMLELKHPELAIQVAEYLVRRNIPFQMEIAGSGPKLDWMKHQIQVRGLTDCVHLLGVLPQKEIFNRMRKASIFLATSDYGEGWGAVINEAMSNGCAVVACNAMGAVPFLVKDGENGFSYRYRDKRKMCCSIERLLVDQGLCRQIGLQAYKTMSTLWNPNVAADRLLHLISMLEGGLTPYENGPCSRAYLFREGH